LYGEDAGVACRSLGSRALWLLGYPDRGLRQSQEAVALAQQSAHVFSLGITLSSAAAFHQLRRDIGAVQERAEAAMSLAQEQGFPFFLVFGAMLRGWALTHQGQVQEGIEQITQGLVGHRAIGAELQRSYFLGLLAEVYGTQRNAEAGLTVLTEALALADK